MDHLANAISASELPMSFHGDRLLFTINLAGMTTLTYMAVGFIYWMVCAIWCNRKWDRLYHPATLYRIAWACAATSLALRSGSEAAYLWAWDPSNATTGAMVMRVKQYANAFSFLFAFAWMGLTVVTNAAIVGQLRRHPLPVKMWAKIPALRRPAIVAMMAISMSVGVVLLRG